MFENAVSSRTDFLEGRIIFLLGSSSAKAESSNPEFRGGRVVLDGCPLDEDVAMPFKISLFDRAGRGNTLSGRSFGFGNESVRFRVNLSLYLAKGNLCPVSIDSQSQSAVKIGMFQS